MDEQDDISFIPLKNLPMSGLIQHKLVPQNGRKTAHPDNVLAYAIGNMEEVSIIGRGKDGEMWFASSLEDEHEIIEDLEKFSNLLEEYAE